MHVDPKGQRSQSESFLKVPLQVNFPLNFFLLPSLSPAQVGYTALPLSLSTVNTHNPQSLAFCLIHTRNLICSHILTYLPLKHRENIWFDCCALLFPHVRKPSVTLPPFEKLCTLTCTS